MLAVLSFLLAESAFAAASHPPEVETYIERRELCEHFRQEPWPEGSGAEDKERRQFLSAQSDRYCKGSDRALEELKKKYKSDKAVQDRLEKYETDIEGSR